MSSFFVEFVALFSVRCKKCFVLQYWPLNLRWYMILHIG